MKDDNVDISVVGGGVMGCAAAYRLAKDSQRVLLLEQAAFMPDRFPLFRHHLTDMPARWGVGFPIFEHTGVKMIMDCAGPVVDPDDPDRTEDESRLDMLRTYVKSVLPTLGDTIIETETCRYTMTPDEDFIIDLHPNHPQI